MHNQGPSAAAEGLLVLSSFFTVTLTVEWGTILR